MIACAPDRNAKVGCLSRITSPALKQEPEVVSYSAPCLFALEHLVMTYGKVIDSRQFVRLMAP